jgi:uncharacterized glyoxalase superfamily protein PhnB
MTQARLLRTAPFLLVADVVKAAEYYRDKLGFSTKLYHEPPDFCIASRDGQSVRLVKASHPERIVPNWKLMNSVSNVMFTVEQIDVLYAEFQMRGAHIDYTLYDTPWGTKEFGVQDVDEYDISFEQLPAQIDP